MHYRVSMENLHAHLFEVTLTINQPAAKQQVALPVWIPGSYLVREFSKNLQNLQARQLGRKLAVQQLNKSSWEIDCQPSSPLTLRYQVYAFDNSVRTAWLDSQRGFFNGTSLFLQVQGQQHLAHEVEIVANPAVGHWQVATGLQPQKIKSTGFGSYCAENYDALVDCPVELGDFWSGAFMACGVTHRFVVAGAGASFDGEKLLSDSQKICETAIRFWHASHGQSRFNQKPPYANYLFMLNAVDEAYGGLEHRNSTALICQRKDLPRQSGTGLIPDNAKQPEGYTTLLGLISHEYFHTWNVKRLRPSEFSSYDYGKENYTELLWFFEGFTSYYDDLLLRRCGLIDDATYLRLLNKSINQVMQTPGRQVQSVAQASFDAWVKFYRPDENTANTTVSYYTKGSLVALCLDLTLRAEGKTNLDQVMRALWRRCQGGPMEQDDLLTVLRELAGRSLAREINTWVHSTNELPLKDLLSRHGVSVLEDPSQIAQQLGLRVSESNGILIKTVLRGGAAEQAGFAAGDEWLAVHSGTGRANNGWRLTHLDDLLLHIGSAKNVKVLVARDKRLLTLSLALPDNQTTWRLTQQDMTKLQLWLAPSP
ncbi:MAG: peptidase M61 [Burkholderiaceae bacterium]